VNGSVKPSPQEQEDALFTLLIEKPAAERAAFLQAVCGRDHALRRRLEALLAGHEQPGGWLAETDEELTRKATLRLEGTEAEADEAVGQTLGRYKLLEKVGEGGCGVVYVAEQIEPVRRRVALKVIKLGMDTKQVVARFEAERQALAMMDHPNIAKVLDAGTTETGRPYFVMELVRGIRITDYCDQANLSTTERLELFTKVCHAIQHAHQKGIIHRDIKPSNILVTLHDGVPVPKVIDFGIAKATEGRLTDATVYTQLHQFIGTPAYMSPEQAEMSGLDIDTRSDIYSLGVLLYELLTGRTPFDPRELLESGLDAMRRTIREKAPQRPSTRLATLGAAELTTAARRRSAETSKLLHQVRGDLDWIVLKCLEKDRARRYETANGLAADITRHLNTEPVVARPPSRLYEFQKTVRRHKFGFAAATALMLVLTAGVFTSTWQALRANREAQRAVAALDELRAAAPAFVEQARGLVAKEQFSEAIEKLDYAMTLRPDVPEYLIAKGDLLQTQLKIEEAAHAYRAALRVQPGLTRAEVSAKLCDELLASERAAGGQLSNDSLAKLLLAMQEQQRPAAELMPVARLLGQENKLLVDYWLARLIALPIPPERPLAKRLTLREDGRLALDLSGTKITNLSPLIGAPLAVLDLSKSRGLTDLSPLEGMTLVELNLAGTGVADLTPLRAMHTLKTLNLSFGNVINLAPLSGLRLVDIDLSLTQVSDLAALRGMSLKRLNLRTTRVADLSPLAGMPLAYVDASETPAADYSPLAGAPLEKCFLRGSPLRDLSFLRNSPVKELSLFDCYEARGYTVLQSLKSLNLLVLPQSYRNLPEKDFAAIGALRDHPVLRNIDSEYREVSQWSINTAQSKESFWEQWDREQGLLSALRAGGLNFGLVKLPGGTYELVVRNQSRPDLSALKGLPIRVLSLIDGNVNDLTPLRDLPLEFLNLPDNPITDLSPLQGKQIRTLYLSGTKVADLAPLKTLPLRGLFLDRCTNVTDVAELAGIPTLEYLAVPMTRNLEALRKLPGLQRLGFEITTSPPFVPGTTPEEFWKAYDANRWIHSLLNAGLRPNILRQEADGTWVVNLDGAPIADLEPLRGAPINNLNIGYTKVTDLSPLRGMPLRQLHAYFTGISDLSPLQGMRLEWLNLCGTQVTNLSVLHGMPLEAVRLHACQRLTDVSPLADATTLRELTLPPQASHFEFLREFPHLERLGYQENSDWQPDQTAEQFWRDYDEKKGTAARQP
jgi:serine/threonine protein kinase/Leucine-rich repeat (LRR) protein